MPIKCQFHLSRMPAVYYTGENVSGAVALRVTKKTLQVEGISITLLGLSSTSWNEAVYDFHQIEHNDSTGPSEPIQLVYSGSKVHVDQTQQVAESLILLPGSIQLNNFEFQIPSDVPSSCRLDYGSIYYCLQLTLERRGKHSKRFYQRLAIRNRIELFELRPATTESSTLCLSLPRSVLVPGQRVSYRLKASAPSSRISTRLCQRIKYESQHPFSKCKEVVQVLDESSNIEDALHLPITAPIASRVSVGPIEIVYYLEALSNFSEPLRVPLFVGSVVPPLDHPASRSCAGFVNFGLSESDAVFPLIDQHLPDRFSGETITIGGTKHNEQLKLIRHQKKHSYLRLASIYLHKFFTPTI